MKNVKFKEEWLPSDLLEFLEAEGITDKFINAIHNDIVGDNVTQDYFEEAENIAYIAYAFVWYTTKEGWYFWNNINNKWQEYLNGK